MGQAYREGGRVARRTSERCPPSARRAKAAWCSAGVGLSAGVTKWACFDQGVEARHRWVGRPFRGRTGRTTRPIRATLTPEGIL